MGHFIKAFEEKSAFSNGVGNVHITKHQNNNCPKNGPFLLF